MAQPILPSTAGQLDATPALQKCIRELVLWVETQHQDSISSVMLGLKLVTGEMLMRLLLHINHHLSEELYIQIGCVQSTRRQVGRVFADHVFEHLSTDKFKLIDLSMNHLEYVQLKHYLPSRKAESLPTPKSYTNRDRAVVFLTRIYILWYRINQICGLAELMLRHGPLSLRSPLSRDDLGPLPAQTICNSFDTIPPPPIKKVATVARTTSHLRNVAGAPYTFALIPEAVMDVIQQSHYPHAVYRALIDLGTFLTTQMPELATQHKISLGRVDLLLIVMPSLSAHALPPSERYTFDALEERQKDDPNTDPATYKQSRIQAVEGLVNAKLQLQQYLTVQATSRQYGFPGLFVPDEQQTHQIKVIEEHSAATIKVTGEQQKLVNDLAQAHLQQVHDLKRQLRIEQGKNKHLINKQLDIRGRILAHGQGFEDVNASAGLLMPDWQIELRKVDHRREAIDNGNRSAHGANVAADLLLLDAQRNHDDPTNFKNMYGFESKLLIHFSDDPAIREMNIDNHVPIRARDRKLVMDVAHTRFWLQNLRINPPMSVQRAIEERCSKADPPVVPYTLRQLPHNEYLLRTSLGLSGRDRDDTMYQELDRMWRDVIKQVQRLESRILAILSARHNSNDDSDRHSDAVGLFLADQSPLERYIRVIYHGYYRSKPAVYSTPPDVRSEWLG